MDFTPLTSTPKQKRRTWITTLGAAALSSGVLSILPITILTGNFSPDAPLAGTFWALPIVLSPGFGFLGAAITATVPHEMKQLRKRERTEDLRVSVGNHYGLALSDSEFAELNYPLNAPAEPFKVYGSILRVDQVSGSAFVERKIYLVWMEGEFKLSSSKDGKRFKELPRARPELTAAQSATQVALAAPSSRSAVSA